MISIPLHSTTNSYHLGNNDEVVDAKGVVQQVTNYYPFGAPYADATAVKGANLQPYKYNGKELDLMHGLNTYDYGARQYNPVTGRWDRMDPLCEKYYSTSPYAYCANNPVMLIDPDGREQLYPLPGTFGPTAHTQAAMQRAIGHHNVKTAAFAITHPKIARSIGSPNDKGTISNTASNFEINIADATGLDHGMPGDQGNAIRHTAWQAMITKDFGEDIASRVADCHEDDWNKTSQNKIFNDREAGDTYVDLKNNEIGRAIGKSNPKATNKQIMTKVMEQYQSKGLYVLKQTADKKWVPVLDKISGQKLQQALQIIQSKNENGLNK